MVTLSISENMWLSAPSCRDVNRGGTGLPFRIQSVGNISVSVISPRILFADYLHIFSS